MDKPNPIYLVPLEEKEMWTHRNSRDAQTQRKGHVRTLPERGYLQAKKGGPGETKQTCQHLDLEFLASRTMKK